MSDILQEFFSRNTVLVYFVYGLVFFLLGFAIALQSMRHTRLELARSLKWLAAFGIIHGIHEWGAIIVPFQAIYMDDAIMAWFLTFQVITLSLSFFCLFQFGAKLLLDRWPWIEYAPYLFLILWAVVFFLPSLITASWSISWQRSASILARYLLGFTGALLASYGLYFQSKQQIKPLGLPHIYRMFQIAGIALGVYAILSGIIVPPGRFFPANLVNSANLVALFGIPAPVFRSLAGLVIVIAVIRGLEVFDVEVDRQIEEMEIERSLVAQRERIGHELHDGAIQQVYTAGLIIESVHNKVTDEVIDQRLEQAMAAMNEAITGLRSYMDSLRSSETTVSLAQGLLEQTTNPGLNVLMNVNLDLDLTEADSMNPVRTNRVLAIVGEALANAARHGAAQRVTVKAARRQNQFLLSIEDDGRGFSPRSNGSGYGLRDMHDHARLLGGQLAVESAPGQGTRIRLTSPWEDG